MSIFFENGDLKQWEEMTPGEMTRAEYEEAVLEFYESKPWTIEYIVKHEVSPEDARAAYRVLSTIRSKTLAAGRDEWEISSKDEIIDLLARNAGIKSPKRYKAYTRINGGDWEEAEATDAGGLFIQAQTEAEALEKYVDSIADNLKAVNAEEVETGIYTYTDSYGDAVTLEIMMKSA